MVGITFVTSKNKKDMLSYLVTVFGDYKEHEVVGMVFSGILPVVESSCILYTSDSSYVPTRSAVGFLLRF